jgi:WhiB family redox-sensing transcriptional regulator
MVWLACEPYGSREWWPCKNGLDDKAKEICRRCPHLSECLEWAIPNERFGIWGATNERERGRMRAKSKIREEEVA